MIERRQRKPLKAMSGLHTIKLMLRGSPITLISIDSDLVKECERVLEKHFARKSPAFFEASEGELPGTLGEFQIAVDCESPCSRYYPLEIETHAAVFTDEIDKVKFSPPTPESLTVFAPVIAEVRSLQPENHDGWWPNRCSNQDVASVEPIPDQSAGYLKSEPEDWYVSADADVYNCLSCGLLVANDNRTKHDLQCGSLQCRECDWQFKSRNALSSHKRDHRYNKRRKKHLNPRWRQKDCKTSPEKQKSRTKRKHCPKSQPLIRLAATLRSHDAPPLLMPFDNDPATDPGSETSATSRSGRPLMRPRDPLNVPAAPAALSVSPRRHKPFISVLSDKRFASLSKSTELNRPRPDQPPKRLRPGRRPKQQTSKAVANKVVANKVVKRKVSTRMTSEKKVVDSEGFSMKSSENKILASKVVANKVVNSKVSTRMTSEKKAEDSEVFSMKSSEKKILSSKVVANKVVANKVVNSKVSTHKTSENKVLNSKVSTIKSSENEILANKPNVESASESSKDLNSRSRCSKCTASFFSLVELRKHFDAVHRVQCLHCPHSFLNKVYLGMHVKVFHPETATAGWQPDGDLPTGDSKLGNANFDINGLYSQSEDSGSERSRSPGYLPHRRQVPKKRMHACIHCPMRCASGHVLRRHLLRHEAPDRIECPTCHRLFCNVPTRAAHIEKMHGVEIVRDDIEEGPLQCKGCDALLISRLRLAEHYCTSHINLALLGCGICKHVLSLTQWQTHAATHM